LLDRIRSMLSPMQGSRGAVSYQILTGRPLSRIQRCCSYQILAARELTTVPCCPHARKVPAHLRDTGRSLA